MGRKNEGKVPHTGARNGGFSRPRACVCCILSEYLDRYPVYVCHRRGTSIETQTGCICVCGVYLCLNNPSHND